MNALNPWITAVSLFAGIGGFDLALHRAGLEVAAAVEIDPECRGILARHFPQTALFPDVSEVTVDQLRTAGFVPGRGILTAGWPCQGNSVAGNRRGMADPRSGLWRHVVRLLDETRPRWFLGENVPGLLGIHDGRDFRTVLSDLDDLGYGVAWRVLDAQWFGVPQRRRRVFLAGCLGDGAAPVEVLLEPESGGGHPAAGTQTRARIAGTLAASAGSGGLGGIGQSASAITSRLVETASTLQGGGQRGYRVDAESAAGGQLVPMAFNPQTGGSKPRIGYAEMPSALQASQVTGVHTKADVRRLTPRECERLQGFPDDWTAGQADATRYRQLGNAVAVPVVEWIARRLAAADRRAAA